MYLVVLSYCEEETLFFNTKKEMLEYFNVNSIRELLKKENRIFSNTIVYEIKKIYEKI